MPTNDTYSTQPSSLQRKPDRPQGGGKQSFTWLFLLLGGIVLVGGGLLVWLVFPGLFSAPSDKGPTGTGPASVPNKNKPIDFPPGAQGDNPIFWQAVKDETAQQLHLSVADVHTKLTTPQSGASATVTTKPTPADTGASGGKSAPPADKGNTTQNNYLLFNELAAQQGISEAQLPTVEAQIVQRGFDKLVAQGIVPKNYADDWMQRVRGWSQDTFNKFMGLTFDRH